MAVGLGYGATIEHGTVFTRALTTSEMVCNYRAWEVHADGGP
jgi:hypothetical protein